MSVEIKIFGETAKDALKELFGLSDGLGPDTAGGTLSPTLGPVCSSGQTGASDAQQGTSVSATAVSDVSSDKADEPKRERGKPSPGRARRTKEEIAEDEAADAADEHQKKVQWADEAKTLAAEGAKQFEAERAANISTGEERINPEEEAQDAADEAADPVNAPTDTATRDDVRAAMVSYSKKFDMAKLTADMSAILQNHWPDGSVTKLSEIPEDAAAFAVVLADLTAGMAD